MPEAPPTGFIKPAVTTAFWALAIGWGFSALVMLLSGGADLRIPARMWLVAHGSGLTVGDARIGIVPLGLTALCALLVAVIAHRFARADIGDLGPFAGTVGMIFGVAAAILAAVASTDDVMVSIPRAAVGGLLVGGLGSAAGAGWRHRATFQPSETARLVITVAVRAAAAVLGAALLLVVILLTVHGQRAADLWGLLNPGLGGGIILALGCLLSLPTLVMWTASVLIGPGFALGAGSTVDLTGSYLGAVPGFPTLVAVPAAGAFPAWVLALGLVLPVAGGWAGTVTTRVRVGAVGGAVAGLGLGILVSLSGGGMGPGRMAVAGPPPVTPLLTAVIVLAATGALGSWLAHYRGRRVSRVANESGRVGFGRRHESPGTD